MVDVSQMGSQAGGTCSVDDVCVALTLSQEMPREYAGVLGYLNRKGDYLDNVLKVNIPRSDLSITIDGIPTPTAFGFGGWISMTKGEGGMEVMMGDLVLLQEEVSPVISALLSQGLEVTALHNHFFWEEPRIFYMHAHGHGDAMELAHELKPALDLIGHVPPHRTLSAAAPGDPQSSGKFSAGKLDIDRLNGLIGHKGDVTGTVYKVTLSRDDISLKDMGARINARMGLNTWAALFGSDQQAEIAGDIAMRENEVEDVLRALRKNGLEVVAIHHHMIGSEPMVIFLHYWGTGPALKLAQGFKAAVDETGKPRH